MITPDLVSIVIVCYNNWPDVELAIESALHQSYRPVEVIVVDNSSSDATPVEVPKRFGNAIRYIRQPNRGDGGAYNTGMRAASGEFLQFLDGDDFLAPNKIAKQMEIFQSDPNADIVYGDVRFFQNRPGVYWEWRDRDMEEETDILAALVRRDGKNITAQTLLYRKSALDRVGEWDETLYVVDRDYWLRAAWAGCRFRYSPGSLSFYGVHPGQMSSHAAAMSRGFEAVWTKALQYITQEPYRTEIRFSLARSRFRTALYADDLNSREALAKLAEARRTNPQAIPRFVYLLAGAIILIPGGRRLFRRLWKGPLRGLIAGLPFVKGKLKIE